MGEAELEDDFEKLNSLKVPVPEDKETVQLDTEEKDIKICAEFLNLSKTRIEEQHKEQERIKNTIPFHQVNIEGFKKVFPKRKLDKKKYPYWPHKLIENL
ncbi:ATP synthase subunit d, mitochondrial [Galemys pyrenaicus]|uniref:ATP synthase subunit d, mitochondrial n=1 Tax=Galemys pyrenaicus TaxID=202257 RepID=A0A8J6AJB0_GALPY|nr:ATP synthase subunit d, mitochondrial [Galemys pyrenaicus]